MTIHNPIVIKCEGLSPKGCPHGSHYYPKAVDVASARRQALEESGWMWNIQTGDLCRECSNILLGPMLAERDDDEDSPESSAPSDARSDFTRVFGAPISPEVASAVFGASAD